jgi:hypothetical protein
MEIRPPSARREAANVLRVAAVVLAVTWVYLANGAGLRTGSGEAGPALASYQALFRDLPADDQRKYRELREGLLEIENLRSTAGAWPAPGELAAQGIPPFTPDPTAPARYTWIFHHEGVLVDYLGLPAEPGRPAFLLYIQEPTPGAPPDRAPNDEEHHRLANGDVLHVSVWRHGQGGKLADAFVGLPESDGWTQILSGAGPSPMPPSSR